MAASDEEIGRYVGELIALGRSNYDIIEAVVLKFAITKDNSIACLRKTYNFWTSLDSALALTPQDVKNWHVAIRRKLLEESIKNRNHKISLAIADSLARIEGVCANNVGSEIQAPISIKLIPVPDESKER
jgi:hypothetical protein